MREADAVIDWTCAAMIGALAGGAFWAVAVYALIAAQGTPAAWISVVIVAVVLVAVGTGLFRSTGSAERRCYGAGLVLAPFTGLVPVVVFAAAGVAAEVGAGL
ncbi:hypothetical protein ASJ79_30200 [Mycobacterium sp. NAZ190054]|nr:hypothetical protein ASJ79_30200 [Mycobacterium sp. NAZ190054]